MVQTVAAPVRPRTAARTSAAVALLALAVVASLALYACPSRSFTSSPSFGLTAERNSARQPATALQVMRGPPVLNPYKHKWVEPTVPTELVEKAAEEGFRLRPQYNYQKIGYVVSDVNSKTRICLVEYFLFNAKFGAYYMRSKKIHYHDEYETSKLGDVVLIAPSRKMSKKKAYRLVEVVKNNTAPIRV
mmetsp:Transcript_111953/g.289300  ORF Transcript_111953/g.289300 Transcript_111953/m.289300 type:complete len:189 (+) Transcript_111953:92-658(+)